ncbi:hypothetical protein PTUN_a2393 [Pseudoalteromonas tunicata]|nr:hypothetical protein PTUN_a2393 [Pseudoalteromonas tunicata]
MLRLRNKKYYHYFVIAQPLQAGFPSQIHLSLRTLFHIQRRGQAQTLSLYCLL